MLPLCIFDPDPKCDAHTIYVTTVERLAQRWVNIAEECLQKMHLMISGIFSVHSLETAVCKMMWETSCMYSLIYAPPYKLSNSYPNFRTC